MVSSTVEEVSTEHKRDKEYTFLIRSSKRLESWLHSASIALGQ